MGLWQWIMEYTTLSDGYRTPAEKTGPFFIYKVEVQIRHLFKNSYLLAYAILFGTLHMFHQCQENLVILHHALYDASYFLQVFVYLLQSALYKECNTGEGKWTSNSVCLLLVNTIAPSSFFLGEKRNATDWHIWSMIDNTCASAQHEVRLTSVQACIGVCWNAHHQGVTSFH